MLFVREVKSSPSTSDSPKQSYDPYPGLHTLPTYGLSGPHQKADLPEQNLPPPPTPRYQHLCDVTPPPAISNLQPPPPPPPPDNFPLMTTALKDLTLKAARHWVVNLIIRIVSYQSQPQPLNSTK